MPPQMYPSSVLQSLRQAFTPRRTEDIELLQEPELPESPANPFVPKPYIPEADLSGSRLPELMRPGAFGPGEVPSMGAYSGELMKGTASYGGPRLNTEAALSGLQAAQGEQLIPGLHSLGPEELSRLTARAPGTVAPGANEYFARELQDELGRQASFLAPQRKTQGMIEESIAGLHPAVQTGAERAAQRAAMPAAISGEMQLRAAQEAAGSRRDVARAGLAGDIKASQFGNLNALIAAMRGIQAKPVVSDEDRKMLRVLRGLIDSLQSEYTGYGMQEFEEE